MASATLCTYRACAACVCARVQAASMRVWGLLLECSPAEVVAEVLRQPALESCKHQAGLKPGQAAGAAAEAGTGAAAPGAPAPPAAGAVAAAKPGAGAGAGALDASTRVLRCMLLLAATPPGHELDVRGMVVVQEPSAAHAAKVRARRVVLAGVRAALLWMAVGWGVMLVVCSRGCVVEVHVAQMRAVVGVVRGLAVAVHIWPKGACLAVSYHLAASLPPACSTL